MCEEKNIYITNIFLESDGYHIQYESLLQAPIRLERREFHPVQLDITFYLFLAIIIVFLLKRGIFSIFLMISSSFAEQQSFFDPVGAPSFQYRLVSDSYCSSWKSIEDFKNPVEIIKAELFQVTSTELDEHGNKKTDIPVFQNKPFLLRLSTSHQKISGALLLEGGIFLPVQGQEGLLEAKIDLSGPIFRYRFVFDQGGAYPKDGWASVEFTPGKTLRYTIIPIQYEYENIKTLPKEYTMNNIFSSIERRYPYSNFEFKIAEPMIYKSKLSPYDGSMMNLLVDVTIFSSSIRQSPDEYFYGLVDLGVYNVTSGLGWIPGSPEEFELKVSVGNSRTLLYSYVAVHELGHNHGLRHISCGSASNPIDANFPYTNGAIGKEGWTGSIFVPASSPDFMGYCPIKSWISDYHVKKIYDWTQGVYERSNSSKICILN